MTHTLPPLSGKLLSPTFNGPTAKAGRTGFRGELGLEFPQSVAGEARPPLIKADQVILTQENGLITFLAAHVDSLAHLPLIIEALDGLLHEGGRYFLFAGNVDLSKKEVLTLGSVTWYVLPLDEATVWNEILDLFRLEKSDLKRLSPEAKIDTLAEAAATFSPHGFTETTFDRAVSEMGAVKVPENRPV